MSGVKGKSGRKAGEGVFTGRKQTLKNPKTFPNFFTSYPIKFLGYKVEDFEYEEMRMNLKKYIENNKLKNTTEAIKKIFLELIR